MIFDDFDRIRIVSLKHRTDRRADMLRELSALGLCLGEKVSFFDAVQLSEAGPFRRIGSHGAYHSHLTILREAAHANESVVILQDDCEFNSQIRSYELPPSVDVFYGGFCASDPDNLHSSEIIGAHFMGFSKRAAKLASVYLEALLEPSFPADETARAQPGFDPTIRPPIDGALVWFRRAHPFLRTEFALLSRQRSSRTDIGDQHFLDRFHGLRGVTQVLRRLKGAYFR